MIIIPAIDLKDGKAVRLTKGLMESAKIYSQDLSTLAKTFQDLGAEWLHVVDLDGAFAGEPKNLACVEEIRRACDLKIEIGGGIRDEESIKRYVDIGIERIILGSIALKNPKFVKEMSKKYKIAVGIDAKDGFVAVEGWAENGEMEAIALAEEFSKTDIDSIICTDISKDGTLSGVNVEWTLKMREASKKPTIASGGVKDIGDIEKLKMTKEIEAVIVGKAFYEGTLDLVNAFNILRT